MYQSLIKAIENYIIKANDNLSDILKYYKQENKIDK